MGTRLYPSTRHPATLEACAGVAAGTYQRLALRHRFPVETDLPGQLDSTVDDDCERLERFLSEGWGRLSPRVRGCLRLLGHGPACGQINHPAAVRLILQLAGIEPPCTVSGLTWH